TTCTTAGSIICTGTPSSIRKTPRHCERSEAIQSCPRLDLDCFVASLLAMTKRVRELTGRRCGWRFFLRRAVELARAIADQRMRAGLRPCHRGARPVRRIVVTARSALEARVLLDRQ